MITDEAPKDNAQYYAQDAAKSAEEARQAAGCDGTAASISAVDVQGLVAAAGRNSNVQALINAVADQVINQLVAKGQIVNNLLATEPGSVLDATQGKALKDDITELYSDLGKINGHNVSFISEQPEQAVKAWFLTLSNGFAIKRISHATGSCLAIAYKYSDIYGAVMAYGLGFPTSPVVYNCSGTWIE